MFRFLDSIILLNCVPSYPAKFNASLPAFIMDQVKHVIHILHYNDLIPLSYVPLTRSGKVVTTASYSK